LPIMIKFHYIAVMRLRRRMMTAALLVGAGALLELAAAVFGGTEDGLAGLASLWMAAIIVQACVQLPTILGAARWSLRQQAPATQT
ncbi:MAG: hypothetical protein J0I81_14440, partial [Hyphomicrobium sp.]|nr:hypothetical protein [Hyphomicrobium sp.]